MTDNVGVERGHTAEVASAEANHPSILRRDIIARLLGVAVGGRAFQLYATQDLHAKDAPSEYAPTRAIIEAVSGAGTLKYADTAAELSALTGGSVTWVGILGGCQSRGDGGGGVFYWDINAVQDDNGTILNASSGNSAGWRRLRVGKTYNAAWFTGGSKETQITNAVSAAASAGAQYVLVPGSMLPYNASAVTFNDAVRMIREGGLPNVFDVLAYGAAAGAESTLAIQAAISAANASMQMGGPGIVHVPPGAYTISGSGLVFNSNITIEGEQPAGYGAAGSGVSQLYMPSSNVNAILLSPATPSGAVVINTVFQDLVLSIFGNADALGCLDLTNCGGTMVRRCSFSGGTKASGFCLRWIGGPVAGNAGFGNIIESAFSGVSGFGSIFLFGGSANDQPDGVNISNCYTTANCPWIKAVSAAGHGPGSHNWMGNRFEGGTSSRQVVISTDANGYGPNSYVGNRFETTSTGGLAVTVQGPGNQQAGRFVGNTWAVGSGGLVWTDNSTPAGGTSMRLDEDFGSQNNSPVYGLPTLHTRFQSVSTNTTLTNTSHVVLASASGGNITITLPTPTGVPAPFSQMYRIMKTDSSANTVTISPASSTINGASTVVLNGQYQSIDVQTDGTNYFVVAAHGISLVNFTVPGFGAVYFGSSQSYIQIDGTPQINYAWNNTVQARMGASKFVPTTAGSLDLGSSSLPWGSTFIRSLTVNQATKTANYTVLTTDSVLFGDATSAAITLTLPAASTRAGLMYRLKKIDNSVHTVTIATAGGNIDGATTKVLSTQYASIDVVSNGTNWFIF